MPLLFAYGTLRRGGGNDGFVAGGTFLGTVQTRDSYTLLCENLEFCPYLTGAPLPGVDREPVTGDLFEVSEFDLAKIDQLEGHPTWYERRSLTLKDGRMAWAYFIQEEILDKMREYPLFIIASGDWFKKDLLYRLEP
jgi:gamma-glutamylcyclotransferase (GGCT)/AIG2-like uncharacterized protein YtfP